MKLFAPFMRFCNRWWVKWSVIIIIAVAITVAHLVMADKYGDSPSAPTWEFTLALHSVMLAALISCVLIYRKWIKQKIKEYDN